MFEKKSRNESTEEGVRVSLIYPVDIFLINVHCGDDMYYSIPKDRNEVIVE